MNLFKFFDLIRIYLIINNYLICIKTKNYIYILMLFYPFNYLTQRNSQAVALAAEKLKQRNLPVETILDEDELMSDLKYSNASQLVNQ